MYMKSVSGDDGSYTLTASFELGTDPDINTVNVNNRVQTALSSLPQDVQRQGVTVKKQSSALLGAIAFYSPQSTATIRCFCPTTSPSTSSTGSRACRASVMPSSGARKTMR